MKQFQDDKSEATTSMELIDILYTYIGIYNK